MYHAIVARILRRGFENLSLGDYSLALRGSAPNVRHIFSGAHAIGGERYGREAFRRWFERVFRLFPSIKFQVHDVLVKGWPWHTVAAVEWSADVTPVAGPDYRNSGVHIIHIRWGRTIFVHAYEDSEAIAEACRLMAKEGIEEASAGPVT